MAGRAATHPSPVGSVAPRLRLSTPGQPDDARVATPWHGVVQTSESELAPDVAAGLVKPSITTGRGDRALLGAVAHDDVDALRRLAGDSGAQQQAARVLLGLRLMGEDPPAAALALTAAMSATPEPGQDKWIRRYLPTLAAEVQLAPGVPAVMGLGRETIALLVVDAQTRIGQGADGIGILTDLPQTMAVILARAAAHIAAGQHEAAVIVTDPVTNTDNLAVLVLVARSVALRSLGRAPEAILATSEALRDTNRHPGVRAAALEERSYVYRVGGDIAAAKADMEQLALMAGGLDGIVPPEEALSAPAPEESDDERMARARGRVRRRISAGGAAGTFGGRHHRTYREQVAEMIGTARHEALEELLLGLLDAVQDEAEDHGLAVDPTFFLTLADLYDDQRRPAELQALRERYTAAAERHGVLDPEDLLPAGGVAAGPFSAEHARLDRCEVRAEPAPASGSGPHAVLDPFGSPEDPAADVATAVEAGPADDIAAATEPRRSTDLDEVRRLRAQRHRGLRNL